MKFLPPPGPERRRALLLVGVAAILFIVYFQFGPGAAPSNPTQPTGPAAASNSAVPATSGTAPGRSTRGTQMPQALKIAEMQQIPDQPNPTRNIFRFGVPPPPPAPAYTPPPVYTPPPAPTPTGPPPPPPVPLKLNTILPHATEPGVWIAYVQLETPQGATPGEIFAVKQGDTVDGRYKVHVVTQFSVVMSNGDGTSRRTWQLPGGGR